MEPAHQDAAFAPEPAPEMVPDQAAMESGSTAAATIAEIGATVAAEANVAGVETSTDMEQPEATGDREDQMAAIRQMLADLKESADDAPEAELEVREDPVQVVEPTPVPQDEDFERDTLKSRIDGANKKKRTVKGEATESGYNSDKLRRLHEKRAKKLQRSRERRKKSGAFVTGFTLVSMVTATMVGLYVLQPQIIDASPKMEPALTEYVVTVDQYRVQLDDVTAEWRNWFAERISRFSSDS